MSEENVKRKVLSVLSVEHQGILPRVTGLFSRRGFNIDSIIACKTEDPGLARWTLVVTGDEATFTQLMRQLLKLEDVIKVEALEMENCSNSELLLIKVRTGRPGRPAAHGSDLRRPGVGCGGLHHDPGAVRPD